jgi:FeS assembly SUF system protein
MSELEGSSLEPQVKTEEQTNIEASNEPETLISYPASTDLEAPIIAALHTCFDPEIPVDIYELGLIYGIDVQPSGEVNIRMTLTSPGCPVAGSLPGEVEQKVRSVPGVTGAKVELVWDPPWGMEKMSEAAKLQLGMF